MVLRVETVDGAWWTLTDLVGSASAMPDLSRGVAEAGRQRLWIIGVGFLNRPADRFLRGLRRPATVHPLAAMPN